MIRVFCIGLLLCRKGWFSLLFWIVSHCFWCLEISLSRVGFSGLWFEFVLFVVVRVQFVTLGYFWIFDLVILVFAV